MAEISPPGIAITFCWSVSTPSHGARAGRLVEIPRDSISLSSLTRLPCQNPKLEIKAALHHVGPSCDMLRLVYVHRARRRTRGGAL